MEVDKLVKRKEELEFEPEEIILKKEQIRQRHGRFWEHAIPRPKLVIEYDDEVQEEVQKVLDFVNKLRSRGRKFKEKKGVMKDGRRD